jgi:hypothetical protein
MFVVSPQEWICIEWLEMASSFLYTPETSADRDAYPKLF